MRYALFGLLAGSLLFTNAAFAQRWIGGANVACELVCGQSKLSPITSGKRSDGNHFNICRDSATGRPGYNLRPKWRDKCYVAEDGKERGVMQYECLCQ
jgi:hypothetical protein